MRSHESVLSEPLSIIGKLSHLFTAVEAFVERRRLVRQLAELDDRLLRDIGLTRQDVQSAASGSFAYDPTVELATRAQEARSSRRAAAREALRWANIASEAEAETARGRSNGVAVPQRAA